MAGHLYKKKSATAQKRFWKIRKNFANFYAQTNRDTPVSAWINITIFLMNMKIYIRIIKKKTLQIHTLKSKF